LAATCLRRDGLSRGQSRRVTSGGPGPVTHSNKASALAPSLRNCVQTRTNGDLDPTHTYPLPNLRSRLHRASVASCKRIAPIRTVRCTGCRSVVTPEGIESHRPPRRGTLPLPACRRSLPRALECTEVWPSRFATSVFFSMVIPRSALSSYFGAHRSPSRSRSGGSSRFCPRSGSSASRMEAAEFQFPILARHANGVQASPTTPRRYASASSLSAKSSKASSACLPYSGSLSSQS
jgi:hypothetical protein